MDRPSVSALANIAKQESQNLQFHLDKVVHLEFFADDATYHEAFKGHKFPNLEFLSLDANELNNDESLEPYLQPKLKSLRFYGGPISDAFLEKLENSCPRLEELLIDNPRDLISPEGFLRFLDGAKGLKHLTVMHGMERVMTDSVFIALATKPDLETLGLRKGITADLVSKAVDQQARSGAEGRLFPRLSKLTCVAQPDGFAALLPHLSQLNSLDVVIKHSSASLNEMEYLLREVGTYCPGLRDLALEYAAAENFNISPRPLIQLAQRLTQLEKLCICSENMEVEGFDTSHFASLVKALPRLETLRLSFKCRLTEAALVEAAKSCEALTTLELWGSYDLRNVGETEVFFPKLKALELGQLVPPSVLADTAAAEAANAARLLKRIAPSLEEFDVTFPDPFSKMVSREVDNV
ncbi:hypothetical protein F5Y05DRAFT_174211 [Hypoxylon sp. FL0543]|nr:hypothetical protein F5Y05DRAFT_174211 [Hypoxylon sp. FL0543]